MLSTESVYQKILWILVFSFISFHCYTQRWLPVNPTVVPEYDSVEAVIMYWPPGSAGYQGTEEYSRIALAIIQGIQLQAKVFLQTNNTEHKENMLARLQEAEVPLDHIIFMEGVPGERIWIRDHGPFSLYDNDTLSIVGFNDLANSGLDEDLPARLANYMDLSFYDLTSIIFDGGNYMVDFHNRLYTTERLYTNNSAYYNEEQINGLLNQYMGLDSIITFRPMANDYWGHIDMQIKLLNDTTFIISTVDQNHSLYENLEYNYQKILQLEHPEGKNYTVHKIPKSQNWKTYINSLIVNNVVLLPTYNDVNADEYALSVYQSILPGKQIIGIDCDHMIEWEGAIHCVTNQLPPLYKNDSEEDDDDSGGDDDDSTQISRHENPMGFSAEVHPNPMNNIGNLDLNIERKAYYHYSIFDMNGNLMLENSIPAFTSGTYSVSFDVKKWPKGIYLIKVGTEKTYKTLKLVVD